MISVLKKVEAESTKEFVKSKELPQNFTAVFFDYEDETHPPIHLRIQKIKEIAGLL
jgi:Zn-dependent protease with chaperone function